MRKKEKEKYQYKCIEVCLKPDDYALFRKKATSYPSMGAMIREAVSCFQDEEVRTVLERTQMIWTLIQEHHTELCRQGNNLNQIAHYCNLLKIQDVYSREWIETQVVPFIKELLNMNGTLYRREKKLLQGMFGENQIFREKRTRKKLQKNRLEDIPTDNI